MRQPNIIDTGIIGAIRDVVRKWRGLPPFGYGTLLRLKLGSRYKPPKTESEET